jgi:hypothetical protein
VSDDLDVLREQRNELNKRIALKEKQEAGRKLREQFKRLADSGPEEALYDEVNRVLKDTNAGTLTEALSKAFQRN